ncbi:putative RNA uridine N3 methyltransferase [Pyrofollis japonicus]|uniref:RNA methyltransferase n=1 Tax=Pyrofollis japonicus TaxID=3060460 RepID=UPI00295ADD4F|nr:RNA methyltransferase [Pyrofollis japonicus]BEP17534.1 putative RNA uridine N3 methyltransferase [Pyrofollis japonicus]
MFVHQRNCPIDIAVAASYTLTEHSLLLKTVKIGYLGRIAAVFRVRRIILYIDRAEAWREVRYSKKILEYLVTAPYLRKHVYPPNVPELRYVGILPPLQLPTHGVGGPRIGEIREALVLRPSKGGILVEAGLGKPVLIKAVNAPRSTRVLVRIESLNPPRLSMVNSTSIYAGYSVGIEDSLKSLIRRYRGSFIIATSRRGKIINQAVIERTKAACRKGILVLFGAPDKGLYEIADLEGINLDESVNVVINTIPNQGTRTVRVEEAISATLAILNLYLD